MNKVSEALGIIKNSEEKGKSYNQTKYCTTYNTT